MKKVMAIGLALLFLTVAVVPSLQAQQAGQQDPQSQKSTFICPRTGEPCPMGGPQHMRRGGRGMRGQRGNCPMAAQQQCPYYTQSKGQGGGQAPAAAPAESKPVTQ